MASANKERPNLKICIDNVDANSDVEVSENDEDEVVIDTNIGDDSSLDGNNESEEEERYKLAAVAKVTARARRERPMLSSTSPFKDSGSKNRGKDRQEKTEQRSKRYERDDSPEPVNKEKLKKLYEDLGVTEADLKQDRLARGVRLDTVHVTGVEDMSTADVLKYFKGYNPGSVEWIDDNSCNVLYSDKESAARAIIGMSVNLPPKSKIRKEKQKKPKKPKKEKKKSKQQISKKKISNKTEEKDIKKTEKGKGSRKASPPTEESDDDELNLMSTDEEDEGEKKKEKEPQKENVEKEDEQEDEKEGKKEDEEEEGELKEEEKMETESDSSSSEESSSEESEEEESEMDQDSPPGKWRRGKPAQKGQELFFRFATKGDKKVVVTEKRNITGLTSDTRKHPVRSAYMDQQAAGSESDMDEEDQDLIAVGLIPRSSRHSQMAASRIPEETRFDQHTRDAQNQRLKQTSIKDRLKRRWSGDDDEAHSSDGDAIVDIDELLAPPKPKRTMRMYADDVEEEIRSKRKQIESAGLMSKNMNAPPKRDIRSRLQLDRRRPDSDPEDNWEDEEEEPYYPSHYDYDLDRDVTPRIPPPRREPMLWRDRDERTEQLDPRALEQHNQVWNRNPDWDQDRYKDLDAPEEDDDGIFGFAAPKEEFGVEVVDLKKRIKEVVNKDREDKIKEKDKKGDEEDMVEEEEEEEDEDQFGKYNRKDWRLKSEAKPTGGDLRSKLKRRTEPW